MNKSVLFILIFALFLMTAIGAGSSLADAATGQMPDQTNYFVEMAQLVANDGQASDHFGSSVAVDGDTLVVGAEGVYLIGHAPNAAYVFMRDGDTWAFETRLTGSGGTTEEHFGCSVAIDGDSIFVGACSADIGGNERQGAAYVFTRSDDVWTQQARLTASDGQPGHIFGSSVSLSGNTALIGAPGQGAAYVFTRSGDTWSEQAKLISGANGDLFGSAVAVSGEIAFVGAPWTTIGGTDREGAVYVFSYDGAAWSEPATLAASDGDYFGDLFGDSLAFDGTTAVIGAPGATVEGFFGAGAAYVYTGSGAAWSEEAQLTASDYRTAINFAKSVAVHGNTVLSAMPPAFGGSAAHWSEKGQLTAGTYSTAGPRAGAVYVYTQNGSVWSEQAKLAPSDGNVHFGRTVALDAGTALIGAPTTEVNGNERQGAAYVYGEWDGAYSLYLPAISGD
ncbi:MAG: FG-GAP repeat protein [Chloroflexota bacterium]